MTRTAPYGSWVSPISISMLATAGVPLSAVSTDGDDVYWIESRATEGGRSVVVRRSPDGVVTDAVPAGFDSRSRAHEYGGGSYAVHDGLMISSSFEDQRVYRIEDGRTTAITPEPEIAAGDRYADFVFHGDHVIAVRERHRSDGEPVNTLVTFPLDGSRDPVVIADGHDFFSSPRVDPDGNRLAWLVWDHPNMPWDGTELWGAALAPDGSLSEPELIAGGKAESIFQPEWSPDGILHFVSDRTGWWNLFREVDGVVAARHLAEAEFGTPQWGFGLRRYAFFADCRIACTYTEGGFDRMAVLDGERLTPLDRAADFIGRSIGIADGRIWIADGSATEAMAIAGIDPVQGDRLVVRKSISVDLDPGRFSRPEAISYPTGDGAVAHALFYPPWNPDFTAPEYELPPLLVLSHGGPTANTSVELDLGLQFWTSRGFAVVDVDYRGSTGYGRPYRDALRGKWGVVDVEDCVSAAEYLVATGRVDVDRMAIRGGSAGGYTTLCALTFTDEFTAGASYFGIGDLAAMATETHKFESRYLDGLIGPYPEAADLYKERSPVNHIADLSCPVILLQGLDDRVVPPSQAEAMVAALRSRGIPHAYVAFEGEGHGFRKSETIRRARAAELFFYSQVFEFEPADTLEPVTIEFAEKLHQVAGD